MATFADLGIPFPLFEAPTDEASDYAGLATCRLCGVKDRHCFELGIGDALILPCPSCGLENGLDADDRADAPCRSCGSAVPFPKPLKAKKQLLACYDCLRAGKAAMTRGPHRVRVTTRRPGPGSRPGRGNRPGSPPVGASAQRP